MIDIKNKFISKTEMVARFLSDKYAIPSLIAWCSTALFLLLSLLTLGNGSLWLDEIIGLSFITTGLRNHLFLLTSGNAHFPAWFFALNVISKLIPTETVSATVYIRGAAVLLMAVPLVFTAWQVAKLRAAGATLWYLLMLALILLFPHWGIFAIEAKQQGLMLIATSCVVLCMILGLFRMAVYLAMIPVLAHAFGVVATVPIVIAMVALGFLLPKIGVRAKGYLRETVIVSIVCLGLYAAPLFFIKFVMAHANDFSLAGAIKYSDDDGISQIIAAMPWTMIGLALFFLTVVLILGRWATRGERDDESGERELIFIIFLSLVGLISALMLVSRPMVPPRPHYIVWIIPGIHLVFAFSVFRLLVVATNFLRQRGMIPATIRDRATKSWLRSRQNLALFAAFAIFCAIWHRTTIGFQESGLEGAARVVNAMVQDQDGVGVFGTNMEGLEFPPAYRKGLKCSRGTLVTMYLDERAREKTLCQGEAWDVTPSPEIKKIVFVDEPGAYKYLRTLDLSDFNLAAEIAIGDSTKVKVYDRK